jgi:hypothetical protein
MMCNSGYRHALVYTRLPGSEQQRHLLHEFSGGTSLGIPIPIEPLALLWVCPDSVIYPHTLHPPCVQLDWQFVSTVDRNVLYCIVLLQRLTLAASIDERDILSRLWV